MENPDPNSNPTSNNHQEHRNNNGNSKKIFKSDSIKSNRSISMSDTESQYDTFHSPLRFDSPLRSDDPIFNSPFDSNPNPNSNSNSKAIVAVDKYVSPLRSPKNPSSENSSFPATPASTGGGMKKDGFPPPPPPMMMFNKSVAEGMQPGMQKMEMGMGEGGQEGGDRRSKTAVSSVLWRSKRELMLNKAALGFRVSEIILCLISFSVMAADKTQGWAGDSFDRYKEYRYLVAVNIIGFVYSGFQACDLARYLVTGTHVISSDLHYFFDFALDQILAYLLMSASSSAATRVTDWISNWGKDDFTEMATASISMSFLAFFAFAISSLICGYTLCNRNSS